MKMTGVTDETLAGEMRDAVNHFTYQWDYEIRHYQTGAKFTSLHGHSMEDIKKYAERCEEFIEKSPKWNGGRTYRGIACDDATFQKFTDDMANGNEIDMLGTSSWSTNKGTSTGFAESNWKKPGDKMLLFYTDDPQNGTSIAYLSHFGDREHEILCSQKSRYKIVDIWHEPSWDKDGYYVKVEVVK